jgi:SAM-dependent methyltransferase
MSIWGFKARDERTSSAFRRVRLARLRRVTRPVWLGTLRRLTPVSNEWGFDRGTPIDRHYIEAFLTEHRAQIRGRVLEIKDSTYTDRFGSGVTRRDVLDVDPANPIATIVADLSAAHAIPADSFDCIVLTQTLQFVFDTRAAIAHTWRILKPGGVVLVTVPTVSRIAPRYGLTTDFWRFTAASCKQLFGDVFGAEHVQVRPYGNVLTAIAFLAGLAREELSSHELDMLDEYFPVIVAIRAKKAPTTRQS